MQQVGESEEPGEYEEAGDNVHRACAAYEQQDVIDQDARRDDVDDSLMPMPLKNALTHDMLHLELLFEDALGRDLRRMQSARSIVVHHASGSGVSNRLIRRAWERSISMSIKLIITSRLDASRSHSTIIPPRTGRTRGRRRGVPAPQARA